MSEVALDRLVGRTVRDREGHRVGRLEEIVAERRGEGYVITEYHLGPAAALERFSVRALGFAVLRALGSKAPPAYRALWSQLDISNPDRPVLTCPVARLERL